MTKQNTLVTGFAIALALLSSIASAAVRQSSFLGASGHSGTGKHPKTSQVGTLIDGNFSGTHHFCFSYVLYTSAKIKGFINVDFEVLDGEEIRKLTTLKKIPIEPMDLESPYPSDDACAPQYPTDISFNIGMAVDCATVSTSLRDGDLVRWRASFKKAPKLTGDLTIVSLVGIVSPGVGSSAKPPRNIESLLLGHQLGHLENIPRQGNPGGGS